MAKTVLIVDDSATIRQVVGMTLKGAGYEVMEACDGKDALKKLDGKKINLIISDVNMPNMDGYQVLETLRKEDLNCLVIVVSADVQEKAQERVLAMGAIAFIRKPITAEGLRDVLKQYGVVV